MKRIFLDTNFLLDYLIREEVGGPCERLLRLGHSTGAVFYVAYLSVANFAYIMRKTPLPTLKEYISKICRLFNIVDNTQQQIENNLLIECSDFEDGLQYQAALSAHCDVIITRNQKDFQFSAIPVMSATEYLSMEY